MVSSTADILFLVPTLLLLTEIFSLSNIVDTNSRISPLNAFQVVCSVGILLHFALGKSVILFQKRSRGSPPNRIKWFGDEQRGCVSSRRQ